MRKFVVSFILIVFMLQFVFALGITPGRTTASYVPGAQETHEFTVVNTEKKDIDVVIYAGGDLKDNIAFSEVSFKMKAKDGDKRITYTVTMPSTLAPGLHNTDLVALQVPDKKNGKGAFIGASVAVVSQLQVFVPYPGKYAEAELNVINPETGKASFIIPIISRGEQNLARVRAVIDIYGPTNEKITTLNSEMISIDSGQRGELAVDWKTDSLPGSYIAKATILYDEQTLQLVKEFSLGSPLLDLQQVQVNDFSLGQIAKFEMLVENKWSQPITGAFAQMIIYNKEGSQIADFKSQTYDIQALTKQTMVAFWDTAGIKKGDYTSSVFLKFGQQSSQKDLQLKVSDNQISVVGVGYVIGKSSSSSGSSNSTVIVLGVVIAVLVIINLLWFLVLRKKMHSKVKN
jgi:hypothetical protein